MGNPWIVPWEGHRRFILVSHNPSFFKKISFGLAALEGVVAQLNGVRELSAVRFPPSRSRGAKARKNPARGGNLLCRAPEAAQNHSLPISPFAYTRRAPRLFCHEDHHSFHAIRGGGAASVAACASFRPLKAVAAMSLNRVIGRGGEIPWHLPEDFRWFKELTTGGIVIMGRKTFASLPKPLPNRSNVVFTRAPRLLSRDPQFLAKAGGRVLVGHWAARLRREAYQLGFERLASREVWLVRSPLRWLRALEKYRPKREIFVIGGAQIYDRLLPHCTDLYLTVVFREVEGDAFFPPFEHLFAAEYTIARATPEFEVRHYRRIAG